MYDYTGLDRLLRWDLEPYLTGESFMSSDMNVKQVSALALASSFYKKLCPNDSSKEADDAALKKFMQINHGISSEPFVFDANSEVEATFYDYFKNNFRDCLSWRVEGDNYDLDFIRETMRVGPGAAQKAVGNDFMSKLFEGPVSYTSEHLIPLYRSALSEMGLWADAERLRSSKFPFVKVNGGKVFFAKKNAEISRTCCTPANLNLLFQMSVGAFIETRLRECFGISLSTQPDKNRELARIGSLTGSFGTIDLVSASDSMSWSLCQDLFEDNFLKYIIRICRDERAVLPNGEEVALNMISTMGNGFTFPLQTLIFACAVKSCYEMMGMRPTASSTCHPSRTRFGVFGDDIIVDREVYVFLCRMLAKLGFEVNDAKSFNTGPFRESCGSDYYSGHNVRGVYIRSLETPQQVYSAINRLARWSAHSGIPLIRTINALRGAVRTLYVPPSESDDCGIKVPFRATHPKVSDGNYWFKYRKSVRRRREIKVDPDCDASQHYSNPFGIATGYLGGYIRRPDLSITDQNLEEFLLMGGPFTASVSLREKISARARYRTVSASIPFWDWPGLTMHHDEKDFAVADWALEGERSQRQQLYASCHDFHSRWESAVMATLRT